MQEDIDLFCWQVPEFKKYMYLQQERGIQFKGRGGGVFTIEKVGGGVSACLHLCKIA